MALTRQQGLRRRHLRVRRKVSGTAERPRLCVHKSLKHIYAQVVDDGGARTIATATTNRKEVKAQGKSFCNLASAKKLGLEIAQKAVEKGVKHVVFDRGGYRYHGIVKALAEAAREGGLQF